mmetsp:Transcript_64681/g.187461  ORF Transcript_64681/g.187461 Transcript_64681/m.187461 type:complete len:286 (+) Transcript_64681:834-1691(+)
MISAPCFTNLRNFDSAPFTSSCRSVFSSLFTKRSTKDLRMFSAGCALAFLAFSHVISSLDFFARSQRRTELSWTSIRSFRIRSSGDKRCFSSSSSFSFSFFFASSSSAFSSSVFFSSASISFSRSFISWSSWNFSGSPPLSGCSSNAIFLYILLMSASLASGGKPKNANAERFWRPFKFALAPSLHFCSLETSASKTSLLCRFMYSSISSVLRVMSSSKNSGSNMPKRCRNSASVKSRNFWFLFVSPWRSYAKTLASRSFNLASNGNTIRPSPKTAVPAASNGSA